MREIKFRIWDKDKKKFLTNTDYKEFMIDTQGQAYSINGFFDNAKVDEYSGIAIQQYTELKDKTGKEIYEGDIVKFKGLFDIGKYENAEIVFDKGEFCIKWKGSICHNLLASNSDSIEVIGNIYENKELLK